MSACPCVNNKCNVAPLSLMPSLLPLDLLLCPLLFGAPSLPLLTLLVYLVFMAALYHFLKIPPFQTDVDFLELITVFDAALSFSRAWLLPFRSSYIRTSYQKTYNEILLILHKAVLIPLESVLN